MKKLLHITLGLILLISCQSKTDSTGFQNGDIIFQTSTSGQSKAIQIATGSKYSHMGITYKQGNDFFVYQAVQPVKLTPLNDRINREENAHYVIKRIKNSGNTQVKTMICILSGLIQGYIVLNWCGKFTKKWLDLKLET